MKKKRTKHTDITDFITILDPFDSPDRLDRLTIEYIWVDGKWVIQNCEAWSSSGQVK